MKLPIGFSPPMEIPHAEPDAALPGNTAGRKSVVQVYFPDRNATLAYYNEAFDLHKGDIVYVEGKLEGVRGIVVDVRYTFKIRLSDYKRVLSVADTHVKGTFYLAGTHLVTFDPVTLPYSQVITWFRAPISDEDYATGSDGSCFSLDDLGSIDIKSQIAQRGIDYYKENKVRYLSVCHNHGRAIVEGTAPYDLEFDCEGREIRNLVCTCPCSYTCKHELAAMLQLYETLSLISRQYAAEYARTGYFAAVSHSAFSSFVLDGKNSGCLTLA